MAFSDPNNGGRQSWFRVVAAIVALVPLLCVCVVWVVLSLRTGEFLAIPVSIVSMLGSLIGLAFSGKLIQKHQEVKQAGDRAGGTVRPL